MIMITLYEIELAAMDSTLKTACMIKLVKYFSVLGVLPHDLKQYRLPP